MCLNKSEIRDKIMGDVRNNCKLYNVCDRCIYSVWKHRNVSKIQRYRHAFGMFISVIKPTWCTKFLFYIKFISCHYMFRAHVLIIRRSKLHYTASGNHHTYRCLPCWSTAVLQPATRIPPQPSYTETPTHIVTRTHDQCGDTIEKSQPSDDGCINARNMLSIEELK